MTQIKIEAAQRLVANGPEWHLADAKKTQQKVDKYFKTLKPGDADYLKIKQKKESADNAVIRFQKMVNDK